MRKGNHPIDLLELEQYLPHPASCSRIHDVRRAVKGAEFRLYEDECIQAML
jgi:hypothetical protein